MMKKALGIILALAMILSVSVSAFAQEAPSEWAVNEVHYGAAEFMKVATGELDYAKDITREEFAIIALYIYASASDMELPEMSIINPFTDCNDPLVVTAYGLGLVKGVSDNEFAPKSPVTREQVCVMLTRIAQKLYPQLELDVIAPFLQQIDSFADAGDVSDWAADSVRLMVTCGIVKGTDENMINPQGKCTTQEALIIAKRALNIEF